MVMQSEKPKQRIYGIRALALACAFCAACVESAYASASDAYLTGYATALLETVLDAPEVSVSAQSGVIYLRGLPDDEEKRLTILERIRSIEGVRRVEVIPFKDGARERGFVRDLDRVTEGWFPKDESFSKMIADPHESRFFLSYRYSRARETNIGVAGLGEVFGLYRWDDIFGPGHSLQLNVEGAVFGYFDLDERGDIQITDFVVGAPLVYSYEDLAIRARIMHRSGHLGDEYIFTNPNVIHLPQDERNLSDHYIDGIISYGPEWWRIYGGARFFWYTRPDRAPWELVYGAEYKPWSYLSIHPVVGVHVTMPEEFSWNINHRLVAGIEVKDWPFRNRAVQFLGEYYSGHALEFPFLREKDEYLGFGIYLDL